MNGRALLVPCALSLSIGFGSAVATADPNATTPSRVTLLHDAEADLEAGRVVDAMRTATKIVDEMPTASASREERLAFQRGLDLLTLARSRVCHLTIAVAGAPHEEIAIEIDQGESFFAAIERRLSKSGRNCLQ